MTTRERGLARWLAAPAPDAPDRIDAKLAAYRRLLLIAAAAEAWHALSYAAFQARLPAAAGLALALTACLALGFGPRARAACAAAAACVLAQIVLVFPENGNHQLVLLVALGLGATPAPGRPEERTLALQGARWLFLLAFAWAGIQKLLYGYWLGGEFLALEVARDPSFAAVFGPLLPEGELARLRSLSGEVGSGPYRASGAGGAGGALLFVAVANGGWLAELVLPPLLFHARTRLLAVVGCLLFLFVTELGAREVFFGALMAGLALLFLPGDANRRALPWLAGIYGVVLATDLGLIPGWSFG